MGGGALHISNMIGSTPLLTLYRLICCGARRPDSAPGRYGSEQKTADVPRKKTKPHANRRYEDTVLPSVIRCHVWDALRDELEGRGKHLLR